MKICGYEEYAGSDDPGVFAVYFSNQVIKFLRTEGKSGNRNTKSIVKTLATIENIRRNGLRGMSSTVQFNDEGKHPSGRAIGGDQKVYAVKDDQVRLYGGIIPVGGRSGFLFVEAVTKKSNKADQALLKKVAKALGEKHDELE